MPTIRVAATAEEDLKEMWSYIAQHSTEAASRMIKEITGKFALLRDNPNIGREQSKLLVNLRSFLVRNYIIFYQPFDDGVEILRILHTSRNIEGIFESFLDSL